jgi:OOP family OmpA-OmpF porin
MRCNWRRWLWGVVPILVLSFVAVWVERGAIERDLTDRARQALARAGAGWASVGFEGRNAVLAGLAWDESEANKAIRLVRAVPGVRLVENRVELVERADKYVWAASRRNHRIRIVGYAPTVATRQAILGVAKASFPGHEVVDRMTLARGLTAPDAWLAGVSFGLHQLASLKHGEVRLDDLALTVAGEAEDGAAYRAIKSALTNSVPQGIKLQSNAVTAPLISPYAWTAQANEGRLVLGGYIPDEATRSELLAAARAVSHGQIPIDQMEPGDGAPRGFVTAALAALRVFEAFDNGAAEIRDQALVVSGLAADTAAAEAARDRLRTALPAEFRLSDRIGIREGHVNVREGAQRTEPAAAAQPTEARAPADQGAARGESAEAPRVARADSGATEPATTPEVAAGTGPAASEPMAQPEARSAQAAITPQALAHPGPAEQAARVEAARREGADCEQGLAAAIKNGSVLFERGSAALDDASRAILSHLPQAIKACPRVHIRIEGHTDIEGTPEANQVLSMKRAQAVLTYLVRAGVNANQLEPVANGERKPLVPNDTSQNKARNRRIEFVLRPE